MSREPAVIRGALRNYDWGAPDGLTRWGAPADGSPQAELWFGSHAADPSPLRDEPDTTLGAAWGGEPAPLLVKLLAAHTPLSLQVHPTAIQVQQWARDPGAVELLADDAEKNEMLLAVEPFLCLVDWRTAADAGSLLTEAGADATVLSAVAAGDMAGAVRGLLDTHPLILDGPGWEGACRRARLGDTDRAAMAAVTQRFGADRGVAVAAVLQPVLLQPGDAVYVPAGVPHAYVRGLGVEIMNSSDNVLRLGLTGKRVSVPHALAALDRARSAVIAPSPDSGRYKVQGAPFSVAVISSGEERCERGRYRVVLALEGRSDVEIDSRHYRLAVGDALAVPDSAGDAVVSSRGRAVVVRQQP